MNKESPDTNRRPSALAGTLKLIVAFALLLIAGEAILWIFELISRELFISLATKTLLTAGIIAVISAVVAWMMPSK